MLKRNNLVAILKKCTMKKISRINLSGICILLSLLLLSGGLKSHERSVEIETKIAFALNFGKFSRLEGLWVKNESSIKIALLIDTSNSMDGLIEQAKSQLWKIVLQLSKAKKNGLKASLQIALYEYGNLDLSSQDDWIRQVTPFTSDLDKISEELFALTTNGGDEYCGAVIAKSLEELMWSEKTDGLQVIFIAGNEGFDQGDVSFSKACASANEKGIIVNTIYCGDPISGKNLRWKDGADLTEGHFGTIDMNENTYYIETPYDDKIAELNQKLNSTYVTYGTNGVNYCMNMSAQDANAFSYSNANLVDRVTVKCSHVYSSASWDLVDATKDSKFDLSSIKKEELPVEMQSMNVTEQKKYIVNKSEERKKIQKQILELSEKREAYIEQKKAELGIKESGLNFAILEAIKEQANRRNFTFD